MITTLLALVALTGQAQTTKTATITGDSLTLAQIHSRVNPVHVLQVGEQAVDAELFDMQGNTHHLTELLGKSGQYVLLDFWDIGCGPCRMAEPEMSEVYGRVKGKLEIIGINKDRLSMWQENGFSKSLAWINWNDGKQGKGGVESRYCDINAVPYYVMISPDGRILWKAAGYIPGLFLGMADALDGPQQDNSLNLRLVVRQVDANAEGTKVGFRYYGKKGDWFRMAKDAYLTADGKRYKMTAADGIKLDVDNYPDVNAFSFRYVGDVNYCDFTLTFEPFDTKPATFDFKESDDQGAFVVRNISLE